ncbi:glycosyltransferase [Crenalkalicoccus roseus]|uniref:glycosyltransferase n=1 Tax=Crenalkalicoccus roseus TaxID=1485588 RepID=UPI001080127F|nr:glycosyltransferase [Crenalkalicoccus roseus]
MPDTATLHHQPPSRPRAGRRPVLTIDEANGRRIAGWAFDPQAPERHVRLSLYNGPDHLVSFHASALRPDLREAGIGNGEHGFSITIPPHLADREVLDLRLVDEESGEELAAVSVTAADERFAALRDALLGNLPHFLAGIGDAQERLRWMQLYLPVLMTATTRTYLEMRGLLEGMAAARRAAGEPPLPEGLAFDRVVEGVLGRYPILKLPQFEAPLVSVVVPVYNKFEFTYNCVKSLIETRCAVPFEVIIVDDQSSDETLLAPMLLPGAVVLRNERNLGFVLGCNRGAAAARGQYLFFLNNDTKLHDEALDALVDVFRLHENIGIAGSKLLFGDGKLQEAGGIIWRMGDGWNYGRGQDPQDPRFNYLRDTDYVSGAALMIPRALFHELGGFDPELAPGYYEDTDLAFKVRAAGYRTVYQPRSVVTHFEGVSSGTDLTQGMKRYQVVNGRKFFQRWKHVLANHALNGVEPEKEKDRNARFRVLFVDATTPTPREDAGSNAALTHMRALQALGAKVTFVPSDNMTHLGAISSDLQDLGIEFLHHPYFWSVEEVLRKRANEFDVVYLHRFDVASRYLATCRALAPRARIVYNVADLHFLRLEREREVGAAGALTEAEIAAVRNQELGAIRAADRVIVHSDVEAEMLRREGVEGVTVLPWAIEGRPGPLPAAQRRGIGFLGGYRHPPNIDAVLWFVSDIWPLIREALPEAEFLIYGSHMPQELRDLSRVPGVRPVGFVEDVATAFDALRLTVAPLRYGAGLKGKVGQSLAYGVPCIGTRIAFEGFGAFGEACTAEEPAEFAARVVALMRDDAAWEAASRAGLDHAREHFSFGAIRRIIAGVVGVPAAP